VTAQRTGLHVVEVW